MRSDNYQIHLISRKFFTNTKKSKTPAFEGGGQNLKINKENNWEVSGCNKLGQIS